MASSSGAHVIRLVVPSHDGSRVLARPNGLAGWTLPAVSVPVTPDAWTDATAAACAAALGATVEPVERLGRSTWVVRATGRITSAGTTWIGEHELGRLGADASVAQDWFRSTPPADAEG